MTGPERWELVASRPLAFGGSSAQPAEVLPVLTCSFQEVTDV